VRKRFQFSLDADELQTLVDELHGSIEVMKDAIADETCTKREQLAHTAHQKDLRNLVRRLRNHARKNRIKILS
jgi:5'-deoxynucleotidase YfbR-like HD superfamily hydrolase